MKKLILIAIISGIFLGCQSEKSKELTV